MWPVVNVCMHFTFELLKAKCILHMYVATSYKILLLSLTLDCSYKGKKAVHL